MTPRSQPPTVGRVAVSPAVRAHLWGRSMGCGDQSFDAETLFRTRYLRSPQVAFARPRLASRKAPFAASKCYGSSQAIYPRLSCNTNRRTMGFRQVSRQAGDIGQVKSPACRGVSDKSGSGGGIFSCGFISQILQRAPPSTRNQDAVLASYSFGPLLLVSMKQTPHQRLVRFSGSASHYQFPELQCRSSRRLG